MKICLINNLYKPYNRGGAEKIVELNAQKLIKKGNNVFIISTKPKKIKQTAENNQQKIYYLNGLYYNINKIPLFLRLFWHFWDMFNFVNYWRVKKILKKEKPDLVITHNLKGIGFLIPLAIRKLRIKHIHTLHDIQLLHPSGLMLLGQEKKINSFFANFYSKINKFLFATPHTIISPSKWLIDLHAKKKFFKNSKIKIKRPELKKINLFKKIYINFLYIGQIENHKGIIFLVNAFQKINSNKYKLTIVGDGSKSQILKNKIKNNKNINYLGKKNSSQVKKLMCKNDCLIVPSICYENAPTVIFEANNVSLPVIASNIGGIPELVSKDFLFTPGNADDLIKKINWLNSNKKYNFN